MNAVGDHIKIFSLPEAIMSCEERLHTIGKDPLSPMRLTFRIEPQNLLLWLDGQKNPVKIFWSDRDASFTTAGIGTAYLFEANEDADYQFLEQILHEKLADVIKLRCYGGICFDPENGGEEWRSFGIARFVIPRFEIYTEAEACYLACNLIGDEHKRGAWPQVLKELREIVVDCNRPLPSRAPFVERQDLPSPAEWAKNIEAVLKSCANHEFEKIVLARKSMFVFPHAPNPFSIMEGLSRMVAHCFLFLFQFQKGQIFLGASPERLYKREENVLQTEAIAGTRPRGSTAQEDEKFVQDLLHSAKDAYEHQIVVDMVCEQLTSLCSFWEGDPQPILLHLKEGHHLISRFEGQLKEGTPDAKILSSFHPTPAVAGHPTDRALPEIRQREPFSRGWYSGPVGYVSRKESEFVVAIRSGLLNGKTLSLFAGAGIVDGSNAQSEWEEVESKLGGFLKVFDDER